jgi:hypothetical protein
LISSNDNITLAEKLRQLDEALEVGAITRDQHQQARDRLLGQI